MAAVCCCCTMWMLVAVATAAGVAWLLSSQSRPKIFGVYSQLGGLLQQLKFLVFRLILAYRKYQKKSGETVGYGVSSLDDQEKEKSQPLSDHPKAIDAVYFNGANKDEVFVVAALARRPKGVFNGILLVKHPAVGLLQLPRMPDTLLFGSEDRWQAEGLSITPEKSMHSWNIKYSGPLRRHADSDPEGGEASGPLVEASLSLQWTANFPHYDFDTDMHSDALSRSVAREPWSRKFFRDLKDSHQTHYEQMGTLRGHLEVAGTRHPIEVLSMRDHSYGVRREWRLLHRYALHMLHTVAGTQFNVGVVSQPITFSNLELGYVCEKGTGKWEAASAINLELWRLGEHGRPPSDYAFSFCRGGKTHFLEVEVLAAPVFYIGWDWEARIVECFVKCRLDGEVGYGVAEYQYNTGPGCHRPHHYLEADPKWTNQLNKG